MTKRHLAIAAVGIAGLLAVGAAVAVFLPENRLRATPRREWKDRALAELHRRVNDRPALAAEIDGVAKKMAATRAASEHWVGDGVLLMKDKSWIAYQSICSKEDPRIHDLFLGRGSDGRWYYSTFHFCRQMTTLRVMEEWRPDSVGQFVDAYWLVPFDGRSDACLKETWAGREPYGQGKLQMAGAKAQPH